MNTIETARTTLVLLPESIATFRATYLHRQAFFSAPNDERLRAIVRALPSWTAVDLIDAARGPVNARFRVADGSDRGVTVSAKYAKELYAAGVTIYLRDIPGLDPVAHQLAEDLELPMAGVTSTLFLSRAGGATAGHFDISENFTVQVHGRKRWIVAPNEHVKWPVCNWGMQDSVPSELRMYAHGEFPREMPVGATPFDLAPGAALYAPRGWWHATETLEDSVSLHIHYPAVTWADIVLPALRARMIACEAWRAPASGFGDEPIRRAQAVQTVAELLKQLQAELGSLRPEDMFGLPASGPAPSLVSPTATFRRNPFAGFGVESIASFTELRTCSITIANSLSERRSTVEMGAPQVRAMRWLLAQSLDSAVTAAHVSRGVTELSVPQACELLAALVQLEFVRPV